MTLQNPSRRCKADGPNNRDTSDGAFRQVTKTT